jgi:hypothetical protein
MVENPVVTPGRDTKTIIQLILICITAVEKENLSDHNCNADLFK